MASKVFLKQFASTVGTLRVLLYLAIAILIFLAFFSLGETQTDGLMIFPTLIAPAVVPMLFFVIPLDMTMCGIMMSGKGIDEIRRYKKVILYDLIAMAILFAAWYPFFSRLLDI